MEVEVEGETETECKCPKCGHKFMTTVWYTDTVEIEPQDMDWPGLEETTQKSLNDENNQTEVNY